MSSVANNARVLMLRQDLEGIAQYAPPDGYRLRWFRDGDGRHWREVQAAADRYNDITPDLFARAFGGDAAAHAQRICFLEESATARVVGTAAAWWQENHDGTTWGRVHWVAVLPACQGRGLSKPLMSAVCLRLRELGYGRTFLTTATARLPALNLYRLFGFEPQVRSAPDWHAWRAVAPHLKLGLGERFPMDCPVAGVSGAGAASG